MITTANAGINFIERHYSKFSDGKQFSLELKPVEDSKPKEKRGENESVGRK